MNPVLNLLDKYDTKATFFILGVVAEKYPEVIKDIHKRGHEIAIHAFTHDTLYKLGPVEFENEIKKSLNLLAIYNPIGFRAPSFSIDNSTKWAFEILENYGFKYDSSIFPIKTMIYGVPNAPTNIYTPSKQDVSKHGKGGIIEFPLTTIKIITKIPIAGGFYLRAMPLWFLKWAIKRVNKKRPAIIYIHPWETYPEIPRLKLPLFSRFEAYYGISSALMKLESLLNEFKFAPVKDVLQNEL